MTKFFDIKSSFESYQKLINFHNENKDKFFDVIKIELHQWFAANMCATLGGILDIFLSFKLT
jgi:hypothetical protein